ncbi:MAG: GIY-YIG nuclease family protein [Pseudomonadota bacterium]
MMKTISNLASPWIVYILQCADGSLYTGITTDLAVRLEKHANGTGAKYTRGRGPYAVIFTEHHLTKSEALKREIEIKRLSKADKWRLQPSE